jgi:ribosomal protein S27AE
VSAGDGPPIVCYGYDGPAYERVCPKCGRFVKAAPEVFVNDERACDMMTECARCGPINISNIGWGSDFMPRPSTEEERWVR